MEKTILAIIQYDSPADQTFLVVNSVHIYGYFESPETGSNAMISVITDQQKQSLLSKGYYVQVVEENPDIKNYGLFHTNEIGKGNVLAPLGKVYLLTQNDILLRYTKAEQITPPSSFQNIPIEDIKNQLVKKNNIDVAARSRSVTITPSVSPAGAPTGLNNLYIGIIILGMIILVVLVIVIWKKVISRKDTDQPDVPPPTS